MRAFVTGAAGFVGGALDSTMDGTTVPDLRFANEGSVTRVASFPSAFRGHPHA